MILGARYALKQPIDTRTLVMNACLLIWGLRLSIYISMRHKEEDYRYQYFRRAMSKNGQLCYYLQTFIFIFMLQAGLSVAVNWTCLYTAANSSMLTAAGASGFGWTDWVGLGLFTSGFLMEAISDNQLQRHIENKDPNKGKFCKIGFWRYSRHPNYFGEALLWWGIFMFSVTLPKGLWTVGSPLLMTLLLRYVSGVRLLEKKQSKHPEFAQYAAETSAFIPWFADLSAKAATNKKDDDYIKEKEQD